MNLLLIGDFPQTARERIITIFPPEWRVNFGRPDEAGRFAGEAEALIPEHVRVDAEFLAHAPQLRFVQTGAGYDNIDLNACSARGVRVCNAAGVNATAVAEHVMALLLCWCKNIASLDSFMKSGRPQSALEYSGCEIEGKTIGVVGMGAIGSKVARFAHAFGMNVLGTSRRPFDTSLGKQVSLEELLAQSDVVSLHAPLTDQTRGMLNKKTFALMKRSAILINASRGGLVEEGDLVDALQSGLIAGACLDVFKQEPLPVESPLRRLPNVILTPHTAGLPDGVKFHQKRCEFFAKNIDAFFKGQTPQNCLN